MCALKALHSISEAKYKEILNSEASQFAVRIGEFCVLDFDRNEKTLYEILAYIKETHPDVISKIVHLLDFEKMKKEKQSMLKDSRYGRRCKNQFHEMIDILIEFSDDVCGAELKNIKLLNE